MNTQDPDHAIREKLLQFAKACGVKQADVIAIRAQSLDVTVRHGAIEDAARAESFGIGLRVFQGHRHAYGSTADASDDGLKRLAQQVSDMCAHVPEDTYTRLARADELAHNWPDLDLFDATDLDVPVLTDLARRAEGAALDMPDITNSDGGSAGQSVHWIGLSSTEGFCGGYAHSGTHLSLSVIGGTGDSMETDYASTQATYVSDLEAPEIVGQRAATRVAACLNPKSGKTGAFPVVFDRRVSSGLLRSFARCISGPRLAKGTSFLSDKMGQAIFAPCITIVDDPHKKRGARSSPFDAEGLPTKLCTFVENGVLKAHYLDIRSASRLGVAPTGHASRGLSSPPSPTPSNLWIENGTTSMKDMLAEIGEGFLITSLMGASISLATGDYSRGASGFWVKDGQIAYPVSEMTIAGNLKDMFLNMRPADDLELRDGIDAPSLCVEGMTVATR